MTTRPTLPLLELDPGLGQLLSDERRSAAGRQLQVEVHRLPEGPWSSARMAAASPEHVGLLLLDGVIAREVVVADTVSTELLGPGDIVRPWTLRESEPLLQHLVRWNALTETRIAMLDRRLGVRIGRWPEVTAVIIDRLNDRAQRLATTQAISQLNRVDRRLMALLWHLAERWGRMTADGIALPLTLSHRMLGQLVGARRPTVSTAIGELAKRDELIRRSDGTWLIKGEPVGTPDPATKELVPIRRKLLGKERHRREADGNPPPLAALADSIPALAGQAPVSGLQAALASMRHASAVRTAGLRGMSADAEDLLRITEPSEQRPQAPGMADLAHQRR